MLVRVWVMEWLDLKVRLVMIREFLLLCFM